MIYPMPYSIYLRDYKCFGVSCSVGMLLRFGIVFRISVWDLEGD